MWRIPAVVPLFLGIFMGIARAETPARIPVIIDTDIGTDIDDALALALALASPELDLRGVTTVSDDAFTRAMIACRFLEAVGRADVPVAAGRAPRETPAVEGQYQYGLRPGRKQPGKETAVEFLYRQLKMRPGEITLIAIGDLTNIAELVARHPESKPWIKRLVLMGGSVRVGYGNKAHPDREWNLRSDVKSAQGVFTSGVPLVVAPLDATVRVRLTAPLRQRIFARETALCWHLRALYELWGKETPTVFDPVAVTLALDESFCKMENLRIEVDNEGFTREGRGPPNCRVAMAIRSDEYLESYVRRIVEWRPGTGSGGPGARPPGEMRPINLVQPTGRGGLPSRIHVAEDYETDIERRWWLAGRLVTDEVPPGSARACRGVLCRDFDDRMGNRDAIYKAVIFNPVPGPPVGRNTRLCFRYRLAGTDVLRVQIYSLTKGYHRCLTLTALPQNVWRAATVDMTRARRPDGSGGPLAEDERIDDIQFYADRRADVTIDDIVLFDAAAADEKRPFPRRIHFTGWFDTGKRGREWPGDFEIVPHDKPLGWFAARSVPRPQADAPWLRVALRGPRPLAERTCLRFRYRLTKGTDFRVVLANTKTDEQVEVAPESFVARQWAEAVVEFQRRAAGRQRHADEIRFVLKPGAELLVDDLLLYEPGEAADHILPDDGSGAATLTTRRLRPLPGAAPGLLRFDVSSLPRSAKIVRADLVIARTGRLTGTEEDARVNVEITADLGGPGAAAPLAIRGPWFDRLDATEAVRAWVSGRANGGFMVKACPPWIAEASGLDVFYEAQPENVPPRVSQVRAVHRSGQTFLVFEEIDDRSADVAPAWSELKRRLAEMDRQRVVRYRVYRRAGPITAASLAQAELLAEVPPMSGYNVLGRSVDQLIARHRRRAIDNLDFAKQLARNNYFEKYHPDMPEMGEVPIARFAVEDGRPLGPRMGLYVHHPSQAAEAYYAVVSVVDGAANTRDISCVGPVDETVGPGEPVLQGKPEVTVFFDYPGERRQYVQWAAPPLAHLPNQCYNWGLFIPRGYPQAQVKRLSVFFHDANQRYLKPPWPHRQDTLLLSPHDAPYPSFGYGYHESLGTLRSFRQGKVQPFFARRVDAMLDWALKKFAADRACVSCGGAGPWGGTAAIQYGLRRPGKIAYVMADGPVDADPQQTPYEYSLYGRGDLRKTHRPDMDAVWGKPEWRVPSESGRPVWEELNLTAWVRTRGETATLPFLSLGAGSQHLTWKQETELMRAYLQTHNGFMAEFFWGSSTHLHLPVGAEEGEHPFGPWADRPVLACDAKDRGPNPDFFKKHFETGQRGYAGGGRLNTQPRWDSQDVIDQPDRLEMTIYAAKHVVYAGHVTCDVAVRNTQRFRPGPREKLTWTATDPRDPKKMQQGEATADAHGHVVIQGLTFGEPGRLVIRRAATKGGKP